MVTPWPLQASAASRCWAARLSERAVGLRNGKVELPAERENILSVLRTRVVARVAEDLHLGGDADDVLRSDLAADEAFGRIPERPAVRLRLESSAGLIVGDGVEVEPLAVYVAHDEPDRAMIFDDSESCGSQGVLDRGEVLQRNHEIEVIVRPSLFFQESVDAPPTIDSAVGPRSAKYGEQT